MLCVAVESFEMVCCEKKENVDVDWNQLGEVNSYLKDFAAVQCSDMTNQNKTKSMVTILM